jgi:hypothetical protein
MIGDLERRGSKWVLVAPTHCGNGHLLRGNVSLGTTPCDCGTRHTDWYCRTCGDVVYGPPLGDTCRTHTGPDER